MPKQPPIAKADLQKTQGARTPTAVKNNNDVISFINQPSMKEQLAAALPHDSGTHDPDSHNGNPKSSGAG